ncbi:MAG: DNA replication/repair protein RecF [Oscillospiraceae bacterium]|nr:DNA replication/repair protein RecF [Oscillospiraceae bacterium]
MVINRVTADGYKNLEGIDIELDPKMNIICGENAQGKTNLVEAVWLCSGCRSFRGTRDKDFIGFVKDAAKVGMDFTDSVRKQRIEFEVRRGSVKDKIVTLNGVKLPLLSKLFGCFRCVVFTPEDLNLIKGSPDNRRSFADLSIAQIKPSYVSALNKYNMILAQRNAALKSVGRDGSGAEFLDVWNEQLIKAGTYISVLRYAFCITLNNYTKPLYSSITNGIEDMDIYYQSTVFEKFDGRLNNTEELEDEYAEKLKASAENDLRAGFTTVGVHRDDIGAYINGLSVREFGSQGQARSAALAMKLAHAKILKAEQGEYPVMLLDDVLSELDEKRRRFILNNIEDMQVIITCCDEKSVTDMASGKIFRMEKGRTDIFDN